MNDLAERLKRERERKGWSQVEFAKNSGVKQSFIGALEARNQENSSWLPELAHALGVDAYWLKTGKGERLGCRSLAAEESIIIDAYRLFGEELKEQWLDAAKSKLEKSREEAKANAA